MKIAIAGYGIEGKESYKYWNDQGFAVTIVDEREELDDVPLDASVILGADALEQLGDFDMVVRTASLNPNKIVTRGQIWSATNEFFAKCPAPIIGVTGTKGKGTTCSLIASILRAGGRTVHLVGNIGVSALGELAMIHADDIVVYELSSFQLWDVEFSPHVAVVLKIEPDHLDVHADFDEYVTAKANIVSNQTAEDILVFYQDNKWSHNIAVASKATKISYPDTEFAHVKGNAFYMATTKLCSTSVMQIPGEHNIENACAAIDVAWQFVQDAAVIEKGLCSFTGLPHRLKFVREIEGVKFYDDSISTTPGSAIAAIRSFLKPKIIILGGRDKGSDYSELFSECAKTNTKVVAVGESRQQIISLCQDSNIEVHGVTGNMNDIVKIAAQLAKAGGVIILSPAAASFDMFKNYQDRGEQFVSSVELLS